MYHIGNSHLGPTSGFEPESLDKLSCQNWETPLFRAYMYYTYMYICIYVYIYIPIMAT